MPTKASPIKKKTIQPKKTPTVKLTVTKKSSSPKSTPTKAPKKAVGKTRTSPKKSFKGGKTSFTMPTDAQGGQLIIVESPAKAQTIKRFLGKWYEVVASMGHVADLPKQKIGIDIAKNFAPTYEIAANKKVIISGLKKLAKTASKVRLATDEDREWEAIARHICQALDLDTKKTPRIVFHEITQEAIEHALAHPRKLDQDLVDAQQARRVLDRLVGFELSPILWRKVKPSLSAGRVQSVAVRVLVEREREIQQFTGERFFRIQAQFLSGKHTFIATMTSDLKGREATDTLFTFAKDATYTVASFTQKPGTRSPSAPFTTSTLQQEASRKIGYSVATTMQLAQRLYEAGHITYMRTDSVNLSKQAMGGMASYITKAFGKQYLHTRNFQTKNKSAQEAHEAIRPTNFGTLHAGADDQQKKLYQLIWKRALASQMAPAAIEKTEIVIDSGNKAYQFVANGEVITFDGFLRVRGIADEEDAQPLPILKKWTVLTLDEMTAQEQLSNPPARYSEAALVKKLEDLWIGRPSTYAPTINTIQQRGYVEKNSSLGTPQPFAIGTLRASKVVWKSKNKAVGAYKNRLVPTDIGMLVTDFLHTNFANIMDYQFTANVEAQFDIIATGKLRWQRMIEDFYTPFHVTVDEVMETAERAHGERIIGTDPVSGKVVKVRLGKFGPMVQIGESDDPDKKFAALRGENRLEHIQLADALELFKFPKVIGEREWASVKVNSWRFGPYVQWWATFASLKDPDTMENIGIERAVELIQAKQIKDKEKLLFEWTIKKKHIKLVKSRRGAVLLSGRKKKSRPKDMDPKKISEADLLALLK